MVTMRRLGLVLLLVLAGGWQALRTADPDVERGNQSFREGHYEEALGHYRAAEGRGTDPRLHFDMGTALYKLGEKNTDEGERERLFEQAEDQFRRAADTDDLRLKSSAYYNLGNSMYQRQQWDDAISAYKRALRADPGNQSARHNLEMALRRREKQDPPQGKQGKQDQQQGQKGPEQDRQQGQKGPEQDRQQGQQAQGPQGPERDRDPQGQGQEEERPGQKDQPAERDQRSAGRHEQERAQPPAQGREQDRSPPDDGYSMRDTPSDQERKLEELERRSRDLRRRLLRQDRRNGDPLHLPSRKDW